MKEYSDEYYDEIVTKENYRNEEQSTEYTEKYDWSKHDWDNDPDWR